MNWTWATINEFSKLHTEPEHVQLIMKLLTERELASEQRLIVMHDNGDRCWTLMQIILNDLKKRQ